MADKPPAQKPPKKEKTIEDILNKDNQMMRSPILWFFLLGLPVVLCFYVALTKSSAGEQQTRPEAVEYAVPEGQQVPQRAAQAVPEPEKPSCDFSEVIGKKAGGWVDQFAETLKRPYRIMPPGAMATQDFSPSRMNFETDAEGIITRVWCG
ncbi:MAG: I78 family peptidase inhibitor [Alphaproteobacteria bacterium]